MPGSLDDMGLPGPGAKTAGKKWKEGREESRDAFRKGGAVRERIAW